MKDGELKPRVGPRYLHRIPREDRRVQDRIAGVAGDRRSRRAKDVPADPAGDGNVDQDAGENCATWVRQPLFSLTSRTTAGIYRHRAFHRRALTAPRLS